MRLLGIPDLLSYTSIHPELALFAGLSLIAVLIFLSPKTAPGLSVWICLGALAAAFVLSNGSAPEKIPDKLVVQNWTWILKRYFCVASAAFLFNSMEWNQEQRQNNRASFFALILLSTLSLMVLAEASGFWLMLLAAESFSFCAYALVLNGNSMQISGNNILRYFAAGSLATAVSIFGLTWVSGFAQAAFAGDQVLSSISELFSNAGGVLLLSFLFFKTGSFPFQLWVPGIFQTAPSPVSGYLASAPKAAAAFACLNLVSTIDSNLIIPVAIIAICTAAWGNFAAFQSTKLRELLAWSAIGQAAFLLIPAIFARHISGASQHLLFYSIVYGCAIQAAFASCQYFETLFNRELRVADFAGIFQTQSLASIILIIILLSIIGIPPMAGFTGKLFVLSGLPAGTSLMGNLIPVMVFGVAIFITVMAAGYFFQIPFQMIFKSSVFDFSSPRNTPASLILTILAACFLILTFFWPEVILP